MVLGARFSHSSYGVSSADGPAGAKMLTSGDAVLDLDVIGGPLGGGTAGGARAGNAGRCGSSSLTSGAAARGASGGGPVAARPGIAGAAATLVTSSLPGAGAGFRDGIGGAARSASLTYAAALGGLSGLRASVG